MSDQQLTHLFHRSGDLMEPDVLRLVEGGRARGRLHRRRRAAGAMLAVATAGVVGAAALAGLLVPGSDDTRTGATHPTGQVRQVAVARADMGAALAGLLPGARPVADDEPYQFQVQRGVVEWQGFEVTLSIDSRSAGSSTTAREQCEAFLDQPCNEAPGGGWLAEHGTIELAVPGRPETYFDAVRLYATDGYVIEAVGERGPADAVDQGQGSDADRALLTRLVLDPGWLR